MHNRYFIGTVVDGCLRTSENLSHYITTPLKVLLSVEPGALVSVQVQVSDDGCYEGGEPITVEVIGSPSRKSIVSFLDKINQ